MLKKDDFDDHGVNDAFQMLTKDDFDDGVNDVELLRTKIHRVYPHNNHTSPNKLFYTTSEASMETVEKTFAMASGSQNS
jgi:hypothetical protein